MIEWTVDAFGSTTDDITVVAGTEDFERLEKSFARDNVRVVLGGENRQQSVWNGLQTVKGDSTIVLVHDAARPLVSEDVINRCISSVEEHGSGVAAVPIVDALKSTNRAPEGQCLIAGDIDREGIWAVQTPQAFTLEVLAAAHRLAIRDGYVGLDDSSLVQRLPNSKVHLVLGDRKNLKVTTTEDLVFAASQTSPKQTFETRIGLGYDIHRLVEGRELWLGGVLIPSDRGLDGHSDADVILHAICDSLLGAACLPDIGRLFPNTDRQYSGISSLKLLKHVRQVLAAEGWLIGNVDSMVIAERPRIAPYVASMREVIAEALQTSVDRISVKATTNEGIGSLGASEGIACHATAGIIRNR